jgi:integrase
MTLGAAVLGVGCGVAGPLRNLPKLELISGIGLRATRVADAPARTRRGLLRVNFDRLTGLGMLIAAFLVLQGILDLAVADEAIKVNPAKSKVVHAPVYHASEIQVWSDEAVSCLIDAHPDELRALPELAASCGMREGELFGAALEDFDFDEKIVKVRRQIKNLGGSYAFALPKSDRERIVPLSD